MIHAFTLLKRAPASRSNVIANYLDLEHIPVHAGLKNARVLAETESSVCFQLESKVLFFNTASVLYFEFLPPDRILQIVKTPLGPMRVLATVREFEGGTADVRCETTVEVELDLPPAAYWLRRPVEQILRRLNEAVHKEDMIILKRRQRLFGDYIEDYLRDEQYLMCKDLFRKHYSKGGGSRPEARGDGQDVPSRPWDIRALLYGTAMPLYRRFELGEGALIAVNLAVIWHRRPAAGAGLLASVLSILVLAVMYEFNDLWDARDDLKNPKKDRRLTLLLLEHAPRFYRAVAAGKIAILLAAAFTPGVSAAAIAGVFIVNTLYSVRLKRVPVLDVVMVGVWGFAYAAITQASPRMCLLVGLLTAICHIFQMRGDRKVDELNGVKTSAVCSTSLTRALLFAACYALFWAMRRASGGAWSYSAFLPLALDAAFDGRQAAWLLSKAYFAALLLAALRLGYAN